MWMFRALALALLMLFSATAMAHAALPARPDTMPVIKDGKTQPVFSYADAVREVVHVETAVDSDNDGRRDRVAVFVTRPKGAGPQQKVAAILEASPYFAGLIDAPYHPNDVTDYPRLSPWTPPTKKPPVDYARSSYDNYFVARGYAVLAASSLGTGDSEGCPTLVGANETLGMKAVVEWLTGKAKATYADGTPAEANWSTGAVAMVGNAYNATLALSVAETGVPGLKTIVANVVTSRWYDYYRAGGGVVAPDGYGGEDADLHAKVVLTRANPEQCSAVIHGMEQQMDRVSGDYNAFWAERDFVKGVGNIKTSVFQIAGLADWNSKTQQFAQLWEELDKHGIDSKLWLYQAGHADILNVRKQEWLDAVHAWLDHWLYGLDNGIAQWPRVQVETAPGIWEDYQNWPDPSARQVTLHFAASPTPGRPGLLERRRANSGGWQSFVDAPTRVVDELVATPDKEDPNRLLYLTEPLEQDLRLSGTPELIVHAAVDGHSPYLTALLVDYGTDTRVTGFGPTDKTWCFGDSIPSNSGCRPLFAYTTGQTPYHVVSRGWLDVRNRRSTSVTEAIRGGRTYSFRWNLQPKEYRFKAGHRLGVVLLSSDPGYTLRYPAGTRISVQLGASTITLPLVAPATPTSSASLLRH